MQTENRIFDDFAKFLNGAAGTVAGMGREAEAGMRSRMREWVGGMDFVSREEFDAVKAMAAAARDEADALRTALADTRDAELRASSGTADGPRWVRETADGLILLADPFVAGRDGGVGGGAVPFAEESATLAYAARSTEPRDALAAIYAKAPPPQLDFAQRWSVWAAGYGGSQSTSGNAVLGSNNTTSSVYGTAVGADYRFSPNTIAGVALAGGGTSFATNGLGWGRSDLFQAGAFLRHNIGAAYLSAALAYGWQDITTDRVVTAAGTDRLRANFNANAWSGRLEGGYRYVTPWLGLTPYAAAQFTSFELPAYAESVVSGGGAFAELCGQERHRCQERARPAHRQILRGGWRPHDAARPRRLGARLQPEPQRRGRVPGAARLGVCGQRRGAGQRGRADHGCARDAVAQRLVGGGDLRRRVLQRDPVLRRQGCYALYVVTLHAIASCNESLMRI